MKFRGMKKIYCMCSGSTSNVKIYCKDRGVLYVWSELDPKRVRKIKGYASNEEVKKFIKALKEELEKCRFTEKAYYLRKAIRNLSTVF